MDETLKENIKRLRVLTTSDHDNLDEITPITDSEHSSSANTLKDNPSAGNDQNYSISREKKVIPEFSEQSSNETESSLDDILYHPAMRCASRSNSDDLKNALCHQKARSWRETTVPAVESDSLNENVHPIREQKRRKRCKRMVVDINRSTECEDEGAKWLPSKSESKRQGRSCKSALKASPEHSRAQTVWKKLLKSHNIGGKRKRSVQDKCFGSYNPDKRAHCDQTVFSSTTIDEMNKSLSRCFMDCDSVPCDVLQSEPSSSCLSSSESECGVLTNDESREADDEQSDCFHENTPGILSDEISSRNINVVRRRLHPVINCGEKPNQEKHIFLQTLKLADSDDVKNVAKNEYLSGETMKDGPKKRRKSPSAKLHKEETANSTSNSMQNMEWKSELQSPTFESSSPRNTTSDTTHSTSTASSLQNPLQYYTLLHNFIPANIPRDLPMPFASGIDVDENSVKEDT